MSVHADTDQQHDWLTDVSDARRPTPEQARAIALLELNPDGRELVRLIVRERVHMADCEGDGCCDRTHRLTVAVDSLTIATDALSTDAALRPATPPADETRATVIVCTHDATEHEWDAGGRCPDAIPAGSWSVRPAAALRPVTEPTDGGEYAGPCIFCQHPAPEHDEEAECWTDGCLCGSGADGDPQRVTEPTDGGERS